MIIDQLEEHLLTDFVDEYLYLLLDGSKIIDIEKELYQRLGHPLYEPIYLFEPWQAIRELSPCLVQLSFGKKTNRNVPVAMNNSLINQHYQSLLSWFIENSDKRWGYLFSSDKPLETQAEILRRQISITTPYGSQVLYKLANPESAWRLFLAQTPFLWQEVKRVWIPSAQGWHYLVNGDVAKPADNQHWQLSDEQWRLLGEVSYQNCLDSIGRHLETWFPETLVTLQEPKQEKNIRYWADFSIGKGFTLEQDLFYFFNILAYLGETVFFEEGRLQHPDIWQLLHQYSSQSPSQRIAYAAQLAQQVASGVSTSKQDRDVNPAQQKHHSDRNNTHE